MTNISNLRALIIDDVATVRTILTKNLKSLGITEISTSDSIEDAWIKIMKSYDTELPIDIIFSDWNMTGGDGIDLLKRIRSSEDDKVRLSKFIMVTGAHNKVLEAMDEGANNIIHKPFSSAIIKSKLELIYGSLNK